MNLREYFTRYPLGCESFGGEWLELWAALGRVLEMPGTAWVRFPTGWFYLARGRVGDLLVATMHAKDKRLHKGALGYRVTIDGTVVKEWGGK
jgi:hypothetical protein